MFTEIVGDLFEVDTDAYAHGVNCKGVMGAGIAKVFREKYPEMYEGYVVACNEKLIRPGCTYAWKPVTPSRQKAIYNLASQDSPGANASYIWLIESFCEMIYNAGFDKVETIAFPQIGCGIGGLDWNAVRRILKALGKTTDIHLIAVTLPT